MSISRYNGRYKVDMTSFLLRCYLAFLLSLVTTCSSFLIIKKGHPRHIQKDGIRFTRRASRTTVSLSTEKVEHLTHIDRVLCISDLHTDNADNMKWLANRTGSSDNLKESDLIVVAGDISHDLETLERSFSYLLEQGSSVLFVPGNHEAWLSAAELDDGSSLEKLDRIYETCDKLGVLTGCTKVGGTPDRPNALWVVPLESWYDGTLAIDGCEDLCDDFGRWPWVDFIRCRWPGFVSEAGKRIPSGLAEFFYDRNDVILQTLQHSVVQSNLTESSRGVMTMSHFLPNKQCLPDWKDVESSTFLRDSWLGHGGGGTSAKFAKVAGTQLLDQQIRSQLRLPADIRQMHLFGHSHRPKDFEMDNIRYIHNPLGKARERDLYMVSPDVDFQMVWDTRSGEVLGETVIRYWEEKGGGVEALIERMANSRKRSRYGQKHMKLHHLKETQSSRVNQKHGSKS